MNEREFEERGVGGDKFSREEFHFVVNEFFYVVIHERFYFLK